MKDFFISDNKSDRQWAEWIGWQLEEAGYAIAIQAWDIRAGMNFAAEMKQSAAECRRKNRRPMTPNVTGYDQPS